MERSLIINSNNLLHLQYQTDIIQRKRKHMAIWYGQVEFSVNIYKDIITRRPMNDTIYNCTGFFRNQEMAKSFQEGISFTVFAAWTMNNK